MYNEVFEAELIRKILKIVLKLFQKSMKNSLDLRGEFRLWLGQVCFIITGGRGRREILLRGVGVACYGRGGEIIVWS